MARKKKKHIAHIDESWLLPYSDMQTLLLALFIVLYASSTVSSEKLASMANSFKVVFNGGTGVLDYTNPIEEIPLQDEGKGKDQATQEQTVTEKAKQNTINTLQASVTDYIEKENLTDQINVKQVDEGIMLQIRSEILFDSGSAVIREENRKMAREISKIITANPPVSVKVTGHTDNVPISNAKYKDNWYLSVDRAVNFLSVMLEDKKLDPGDFSAAGYGEMKPIASNNTAAGRQKNRRIEIYILPQGATKDS